MTESLSTNLGKCGREKKMLTLLMEKKKKKNTKNWNPVKILLLRVPLAQKSHYSLGSLFVF